MNKKYSWQLPATVLLASLAGFAAHASEVDSKPCATVSRAEKGVQIIPVQGAVVNKVEEDMSVDCGAMVSTHQGVLYFKYLTQTTFKLSAETFFEMSKNADKTARNEFFLYRGQVLLNSPPLEKPLVINTPNSRIEFKGGVTFVEYEQPKKTTTAASFNRSFEFKNKFNTAGFQTVRVGEISHFTSTDARLSPAQPEIMSAPTVNESLSGFQMTKEERTDLTSVVENVFESRSKSFNTDFDHWQEIAAPEAARGLASDSESPAEVAAPAKVQVSKRSVETVDPKEAEFSMELMRKHLYGDDEDQKALKENSRKPASQEKIKDTEYEKQKSKVKKETGNVIKEISGLKDGE